MSCLFSRMVMITDNDDDDHVTNLYCYGISPWIWSLHFFSTSEFRPGNKKPPVLRPHCDVTRFEWHLNLQPDPELCSHQPLGLVLATTASQWEATTYRNNVWCLSQCMCEEWSMDDGVGHSGHFVWWNRLTDILYSEGNYCTCFFSFRFEFSHTKSFTFHWYPRGNIPKGYLVKGLRWMRQRYLRDRTHTYRFQMCVSICLDFRICHYILIYLKFLTLPFLKSLSKTKVFSFWLHHIFLGQKATYLNKNHQQNSCQEQASSDACANLITGSLTVKSFADALQWKDPRFRTSGGWFIRVKNLRVYGVEIWFFSVGFIIL